MKVPRDVFKNTAAPFDNMLNKLPLTSDLFRWSDLIDAGKNSLRFEFEISDLLFASSREGLSANEP